jgi:N6-L-threonylcarbamoyladenine synthase
MYVLGVDTSCDDTSCGIIKCRDHKIEILANIVKSQSESTKRDGGVVPHVCAGNHCENLEEVVKKALQKAGLKIEEIDILASTSFPGMIGSLIVGNRYVGTLACLLKKIYIPVHHIEAHMSVCDVEPPFLVLVVSGGHTLIAHYISFGRYKIICSSLDDAAGEVFDKIGREMGLDFPSGPQLEKLANEISTCTIPTVSVMKGKLAFSFSGLKTAYKKMIGHYPNNEIAYSLQESIGEILAEKLKIAIAHTGINKVVACGGVMCNISIRSRLEKVSECYFPPIDLCTDNGVMVACAAFNHWKHKSSMVNNFDIEEKASVSLEEWSNMITF